jgi:hypothetical protein
MCMKKVISILFIASTILFFSCQKMGSYMRVKNEYSQELYNVVVGSAQIGNVPSGGTSDYQLINTGSFSISGTTSTNQALSGSGSISAGNHHWTITINSTGKVSIAADY